MVEGFFALPFTMLTSMYLASVSLIILFVHNLIWLVCDPKMCTYIHMNIWKKWKVFSHSSSSLFFSNPKELTTFFFVVNRKASNFDKNMKELLLRFYNETVFPLLWRCHAERHSFKTFMNYLLYPKNHKKLPSIT